MKTWNVTIETLQPLSIASEPNRDAHWETTSVIPGSTLRGAVAEVWKYTAGFDHPLTKKIFNEGLWRDSHTPDTILNPLYIREQKKQGGKTELLTAFIKTGDFPLAKKTETENDPLMEVSTFQSETVIDEAVGIKISPAREANSHGDLYTLSAVAQGTVFQSTATLPQEGIEVFAEKGNGFYECFAVIGKKTSSGYGKVRIIFKEASETGRFEELDNRIQSYALNKTENDRFYITLVLKSPLLLRDDYGRYTNKISWEHHILAFINNPAVQSNILGKLEPVLFWGKSEQRHGWNSAWNMPKQAELVTQAGAVSVTAFNGLSTEERASLIQALVDLERSGLGERTNEGFGELEICPALEFRSGEESPEEKLPGHEDLQLLLAAKEFAHVIQGRIRTAQWHNLLTFPETEIVKQVLGEGQEYYLSKRETSRVRNKWKESIKYKGKDGSIALHVRDIVQDIYDQHQNYRIAGEKTKKFIDYVIGYVRIYQKEEVQ